MGQIVSNDGTTIGYVRTGTGPALVLVHGGLGDHTRWALVEKLQDSFTIYAMDRRGRGLSGDSEQYSLEREVEDVAAVANSVDGPVNLYGVSSGAIYALEAALRIPNLHRLVLYEPGIPQGEEIVPSEMVDGLQALIDEGKPEDAFVMTSRDIVGLTPEAINRHRTQPSWPERVASAYTIPREVRTLNDYRFRPERFERFQVPTLLLKGTESPQFLKNSVNLLDTALQNSRINALSGQGHTADIVAPEMVAKVMSEFLSRE